MQIVQRSIDNQNQKIINAGAKINESYDLDAAR